MQWNFHTPNSIPFGRLRGSLYNIFIELNATVEEKSISNKNVFNCHLEANR